MSKVKIFIFLIIIFFLLFFSFFLIQAQNYGLKLNFLLKEIEGFAWGDSYLGFLSSNCRNENECLVSNYKLMSDVSFPIIPSNLKIEWYFCDWDQSPILTWQAKSQTKIQIQFSTSNDFSTIVFDSKEISWPFRQFPSFAKHWSSYQDNWALPHPQYGNSYYWRIRIQDEKGNWSPWVQGEKFTLPLYKFPKTYFDWSPQYPSEKEVVSFHNLTLKQSGYQENEKEKLSFTWKIPEWEKEAFCVQSEGCPCETYPNCFEPKVEFKKTKQFDILLEATYEDLKKEGLEDKLSGSGCGPGCCEISRVLSLFYPLPSWREAPPK